MHGSIWSGRSESNTRTSVPKSIRHIHAQPTRRDGQVAGDGGIAAEGVGVDPGPLLPFIAPSREGWVDVIDGLEVHLPWNGIATRIPWGEGIEGEASGVEAGRVVVTHGDALEGSGAGVHVAEHLQGARRREGNGEGIPFTHSAGDGDAAAGRLEHHGDLGVGVGHDGDARDLGELEDVVGEVEPGCRRDGIEGIAAGGRDRDVYRRGSRDHDVLDGVEPRGGIADDEPDVGGRRGVVARNGHTRSHLGRGFSRVKGEDEVAQGRGGVGRLLARATGAGHQECKSSTCEQGL